MIIDSHCHLNFDMTPDTVDFVVDNAVKSGVSLMLNVATDVEEYPALISSLERYPSVYGAFGIHPESIKPEKMITKKELLDYVRPLKIIGLGETGLDYHYENVDRKYQQESFMVHIEAAREANIPVIIHTRDADEDLIGILKESFRQSPFKAVVHSFSSSKKLSEELLDMGMYISLSGMITFKNADDLREIVKYLPVDKLLVETDTPFLAPVPYRGKQNEPAFVLATFEKLAELKKIDKNQLEDILQQNFFSLFSYKLNQECLK